MGPYGHMGSMWNDGYSIWMVVAWISGALVIAAVVWAALRSNRRQDSPKRILERRLATGEIDRETYRQMLRELHG